MISISVAGKSFSIIRLNELSSEDEFSAVKNIISDFECPLNDEVEEFFQKDKISKTVLKRLLRNAEDTGEDFLNVPAILVAQLGKNYKNGNNECIAGEELLCIISYFVKSVQSLIGGAVYFLECDSDKNKVIKFYEDNGFVLFSSRKTKSKKTKLLQFMKKI